MKSREFNVPCPKCTNGIYVNFHVDSPSTSAEQNCSKCGHTVKLRWAPQSSFGKGGGIDECVYCGCNEFYIQKDFSRIMGIGLIVLGCILAPFTYYLSLVALTLLDYVLYRRIGLVTACYGCEGVIRGQPLSPSHGPFQLTIRDKYRFGATS